MSDEIEERLVAAAARPRSRIDAEALWRRARRGLALRRALVATPVLLALLLVPLGVQRWAADERVDLLGAPAAATPTGTPAASLEATAAAPAPTTSAAPSAQPPSPEPSASVTPLAPTSDDSVAILLELAESAEATPPESGRYLYTRTRGVSFALTLASDDPSEATYEWHPYENQDWTADDGSGRMTQVSSELPPSSDPQQGVWPGLREEDRNAYEQSFEADERHDDITQLPADPDLLPGALGAPFPADGAPEAPQLVGRSWPLLSRGGPELRAAAYRMLATLPGLQVERGTTDRAGRPAVRISLESDHTGLLTRISTYVDPATGRALGGEAMLLERASYMAPDVALPFLESYSTTVEQTRVDSLDAVPSAAPSP